MADRGDDAQDNDQSNSNDEDKDDSSLLSEPEDDDREEEMLSSRMVNGKAVRRDDVDSEAETERLELTPRHPREAAEAGIGRTPSKLSKVQSPDEELSEPPSPLPNDVGAASSTSTVANGKKRKRSDTLESPLSSEASIDGESPRKRAGSFKDEHSTEDNSREETTEVVEGNAVVNKTTKIRKSASRRGGRLGRRIVEARDTIETDQEVPEPEAEETIEPQLEEDPIQKSEATDAFSQLAKQFTAFRDALLGERLATVEKELALLEQPQCEHPEYVRMVACVQQRRIKQDRETRAFHHYRQIATRQKTLAERSQMHSQYFQTIREIREEALDSLGTSWYSITRERRQGVNTNPEDDNRHVYRYVDKRSDLLRQQAKYNREVSILSGIAKYVGFPAAPEISGVEGDCLENDLRAMRLARPVHQHITHSQSSKQPLSYDQRNTAQQVVHPHIHRQAEPNVASAERLAHDRFIEQHAWAQAPQSNSYAALTSTPNISHTPDWAHATGYRKPNLLRHQLESPADGVTPIGTPVNGRPAHGNVQDIPNSADQIGREQAPPGSSPLQVPKQRMNGTESNGWRNYSGTSTIDAPLGEGTREHEAYDTEQHNLIRRDFAREQRDPRSSLPVEGSVQYESQSRLPMPSSMFEKPDIFRTAGFRPLEGTFATPTASSTVAGRSSS
ncbi:hypothetical protein AMS68_002446 [Peltaster fructicola]|uniref:Transcriptional regulatory protein DEP1 n=1 Tax=Peltaster fructicola TaxID=286661 RepID=A0A6H0XQN3_9PEZI|nr:hypothetical protein AMS68_002446 [Peltaster fructicola]